MLKLRHGPNFSTQSGAAWRILFSLALMPWLRRYRIHPDESSTKSSALFLLQASTLSSVADNNASLVAKVKTLEKEIEALRKKLEERNVSMPADSVTLDLSEINEVTNAQDDDGSIAEEEGERVQAKNNFFSLFIS